MLCVTHPWEEKKHRRFSLILVEADRRGITRNRIKGKMGIRASDTAELVFEDVRVPAANIIGKPGRGFYHLMHFFDITRTHVAAQGVGLAQGALDKTLRYVRERKTRACSSCSPRWPPKSRWPATPCTRRLGRWITGGWTPP